MMPATTRTLARDVDRDATSNAAKKKSAETNFGAAARAAKHQRRDGADIARRLGHQRRDRERHAREAAELRARAHERVEARP